MSHIALQRRVVPTASAGLEKYHLEEPPRPEMSWLPMAYGRATGDLATGAGAAGGGAT